MRIGIDARFYGGEQSKGLGRYTQKLIEYLAQDDHENDYVIFLQADGFQQWNITNPRFTPVLAPYRWYTLAEQICMPWKIWRARVDLMHFPHFNVPLLYCGRFIVTIHDLIILRFPTRRATTLGPMFYAFKQWGGKAVLRHAVQRSQMILTVSEFSKRDIRSAYNVPAEKIHVTYEAADPVRTHVPLEAARRTLATYGIREPYFLYVGNAYPHKNIETLIPVVAQLKQRLNNALPWTFVCVGKMDYFYQRFRTEVQAAGLQEHILFPGFVPDEELPAFYQQCLAYFFPSEYEGFGLPALEAMSYHIPVIAADASCLPEILGDAALYCKPKDISGIINAIEMIAHDDALRRRLIAAGDVQLTRYSWKQMMHDTRELYLRYGKHS